MGAADRGIPDVIGYLRLIGARVPAHTLRAAQTFRYHRRVFMAPPWREIFTRDAERKQDFAEAERTYEVLAATYLEFDYELIELPRAPVEDRVRLVLAEISRSYGPAASNPGG